MQHVGGGGGVTVYLQVQTEPNPPRAAAAEDFPEIDLRRWRTERERFFYAESENLPPDTCWRRGKIPTYLCVFELDENTDSSEGKIIITSVVWRNRYNDMSPADYDDYPRRRPQ